MRLLNIADICCSFFFSLKISPIFQIKKLVYVTLIFIGSQYIVVFGFTIFIITLIAPNTAITKFANTADLDETAHNKPSHLDLQCLPSCL